MQAAPDGPSSSDEPRLKRNKPSGAEEEGAQQAPTSEGHSTAGEEEAKRRVADGGEEQGEEAVVGHSKEEGETAPAASPLPLGSMPPGNTLPGAECVWYGCIDTSYMAYSQQGHVYSDQPAFFCQSALRQPLSLSHCTD